MAHLAFLIGAGHGIGIVDPFTLQRMSAARLHPRRDDEGHDTGNTVDTGAGDDPQDPPQDDPKDNEDPKDPPKDETDWKAMARKHEREAKANRAAAAELEKIRDKNRTAEEKATKAAQDAAERAEKAEARAAVLEAALTHGITDKADLAMLEELPADKVDAFAKRLSASNKKTAPAGASGNEVTGSKQKASLEQQLADAQKNRDFQRVIAIKQQMYAK